MTSKPSKTSDLILTCRLVGGDSEAEPASVSRQPDETTATAEQIGAPHITYVHEIRTGADDVNEMKFREEDYVDVDLEKC